MSYQNLVFALDAVHDCCSWLAPSDGEQYVPGGRILNYLSCFWPCYNHAQSLLNCVPPDALQDLSTLSCKPWDLATRHALDSLADFVRRTLELSADEEPTVVEYWRTIDIERWLALRDELNEQTLNLRAIRGRRYPGWNDDVDNAPPSDTVQDADREMQAKPVAPGTSAAALTGAQDSIRYRLFDLQQAARRLDKAIESIPSGAHQHRPLACPHYLHEIERLAIEFARRFRDDFAAAHGRWLTATSNESSTALLTALSERTYHVHPNDMELTEKGKSTYWALVDNPAATLDRVALLLRQAIESALAYAELPQKLDAERQAGRAGDIQDAGRGDTGNRAGVVREDARLKSHGGGQNTTVDVAVEHLAAATTTQELSADVNTKRQELPPTRRQRHLKWLATAMLLVRDHPDWSDAEIARQVKVDKSRLSRSREYKAAAALARGSSADRHQGYVRTDPDSGLSDMEAVAPAADWCQDKTDRGQPIEGSKYFREYCAECGEAMKVTKDQVGKNPICEDCQP